MPARRDRVSGAVEVALDLRDTERRQLRIAVPNQRQHASARTVAAAHGA
jgi:hypothetical protein